MNRVALCFSLYFWAQVIGTAVRPANNNTIPSLWEVPSDDDRYSSVYTYHSSAPYASLGWEKIVEATVYKFSDDRSERDVIDNLQVVPGAFDRLLNGMNLNEKVHIITLLGLETKGGKAVVFNSIGAATTDIPLPDEEFFNFDFQSFESNNHDAREDPTILFGVFATKPFKRFGKWFILQMIRYPEARNGIPDQVLRLRALALQVSSGAIFLTLRPAFMTAEDDLKTMVNYYPTDASPVPVVGLAAAAIPEHGPRQMLQQQFDKIKRKVDISQVLQPIGDVGSFKVGDVDRAPDFIRKGPAEYFRQHYDAADATDQKNLCNNFREAARMGNLIMTSVRDDRSIAVGVLKNLMTDTVSKLNDLTLNVKHMFEQVAYKQCNLTVREFLSSQVATRAHDDIVNNYDPNDLQHTEQLKQRFKNHALNDLKQKYGAGRWPTMEKECLNALNVEFTAWSEHVDTDSERKERVRQTERADAEEVRADAEEVRADNGEARADTAESERDHERTARQAAEGERQAAESERQAAESERQAAEARASVSEARASVSEARANASEARANTAEARVNVYESELREADAKLFWYEVIEWLKYYWWVIVIGLQLVGLTILVKIAKICRCCKKTFGKSPQEKLASRLEAAISTNALNAVTMPSSQPIRIEIAGGKTRGKM